MIFYRAYMIFYEGQILQLDHSICYKQDLIGSITYHGIAAQHEIIHSGLQCLLCVHKTAISIVCTILCVYVFVSYLLWHMLRTVHSLSIYLYTLCVCVYLMHVYKVCMCMYVCVSRVNLELFVLRVVIVVFCACPSRERESQGVFVQQKGVMFAVANSNTIIRYTLQGRIQHRKCPPATSSNSTSSTQFSLDLLD